MQLNKYEKFIEKLSTDTQDEKITWRSLGRRSPITIKDEDFITRSFKCEDYKENTTLYLFKFLIPRYTISYGEEFDEEIIKVFIYENDSFFKELTNEEVDPILLFKLYQEIDNQNEKESGFFDEFE